MSDPTDTAVAVVYYPEKHKFLLLKRSKSRENFPGYWEFPAGKVEDGESPKRAARRELKEETGLDGELLRSGDSHTQETEYGNWRVHPYLYLVDSDDVQVTEEHSDYMWVEREKIGDMKTVDGLMQDLHAVEVK